ncbi:MAG: DUF3333 domain-containing protein, partial [Desulfobulbaceae bacterium]|nr:DUF3333 domain-containing protein [Desulfobulbaceae bacterium]
MSNESEKTIDIVKKGLGRRYRVEKRFRLYGALAIGISLLFLALLFASIIARGHSAFQQTFIKLSVELAEAEFDLNDLGRANYQGLIKKTLRKEFPQVKGRSDKKDLYSLVSGGAAFKLHDLVTDNPSLIGETVEMWVPADDDVDMYYKGYISREVPEEDRRLKD